MRTTTFAATAITGLLLAACSGDRALSTEAAAPLANVAAQSTPCRATIARGNLVRSSGTFASAALSYDQCLDASDDGSNPGIELWPTEGDATSGTSRLQRSNDNNGQWDYRIAGAFFENGQAVAYGTRTGSHGPQGRVWRSTPDGPFLVQEPAAFFIPKDEGSFCSQALVLDRVTSNVFVTYDRRQDDSGVGTNAGITVRRDSCTGSQVWRANDNNGQWNYRIDGVYVVGGALRIVGARNPNGRNPNGWQSRVWSQPISGSFLLQTAGL